MVFAKHRHRIRKPKGYNFPVFFFKSHVSVSRNSMLIKIPTRCNSMQIFIYCKVTLHSMKREDQQDATIRCLLLTSVSTCFGHHYTRLQENKGPVTAFGVLFWFCWMWLVAVVGALRCRMRALLASYNGI
jgi:hypothetical protein